MEHHRTYLPHHHHHHVGQTTLILSRPSVPPPPTRLSCRRRSIACAVVSETTALPLSPELAYGAPTVRHPATRMHRCWIRLCVSQISSIQFLPPPRRLNLHRPMPTLSCMQVGRTFSSRSPPPPRTHRRRPRWYLSLLTASRCRRSSTSCRWWTSSRRTSPPPTPRPRRITY